MFRLRDYQQRCVDNIMTELEVNDYNKVGIVAPTGSGKTEIFVETASRYLELHPDKYVLILSHLSLLTTQTFERFRLRTPSVPVSILQANRIPDERAKVVVSTMQSSRKEEKLDLWLLNGDLFGIDVSRKDVGLIIVDECHYLMTTSYNTIIDKLLPNAKILGCTATPYRSARIMLNYFEKTAFTISLEELIELGHLVEPKLQQIKIDSDASASVRMNIVASTYAENEKGKKAVVFMRTIDDAKIMRNVLVQRGIKAKTVTSMETDDVRDKILEGMRCGLVDVLVTVNVLSAGVDIPNLEVILMPYPTKSPTLFIQRVGRALRPYDGKSEARIYLYGTAPEIEDGVYTKILKRTLEVKAPVGSDLRDELELMELTEKVGSEQYAWTKRMVDFADKFEAIGASGISDLIVQQDFPKRFLDNISTLVSVMPNEINYTGHKVTIEQKKVLTINGFNASQIEQMSYVDADTMINMIQSMRVKMSGDNKWLLPSGRYMGKHVKDVPYGYRNSLMFSKNQGIKDSIPAKMLRKWWLRKERG